MKRHTLALAILISGTSTLAYASPIQHTINGLPIGGADLIIIQDTFAGVASLSKTCGIFPINLNCTLAVTGEVTDTGTDARLEITSAVSSGSSLCSGVGFNLPPSWVSTTAHMNLPTSASDGAPVLFMLSGVGVTTSCGNCGGTLPVTYTNNHPGIFAFSGTLPYTGSGLPGNCSVSSSSLTSVNGNAYKIWH